MYLLAIYNPAAGSGSAKSLFEEHVYPLLAKHHKNPAQKIQTQHAWHAANEVAKLTAAEADPEEICVILGSGDGTVHEVINSLTVASYQPSLNISIVLVPCGTANALYNSFFPPSTSTPAAEPDCLRSLNSFLGLTKAHLRPLALAKTSLPSAKSDIPDAPNFSLSAIVVSTALHASILFDSESLRSEMPGIERFKVAAEKNSTRWYSASAKFLPMRQSGVVQIYDPTTKKFGPHTESDQKSIVHLSGPFAYFLSTVNVDRLEPAFRVTPLSATLPATEPALDVVIVRPLRDPAAAGETPEAKLAFVHKLWKVLKGAYDDGAHVDMCYNSAGDVDVGHTGDAVVEYIRCGGWEWTPDESDEKAHLVCADGDISTIERGGKAVCIACTPEENPRFSVYT